MVGNEGFGQKLRAAVGAENYMGCLGKLQGLFCVLKVAKIHNFRCKTFAKSETTSLFNPERRGTTVRVFH